MALLEKLSNVAAAAHAPFIAAAGPKLFDMDSFTQLGVPRDLAKIFESLEMIKWRSFRDSEDSRYVTLAMPRILLRLPYGAATIPVEGMSFEEDVDGRNHDRYLWGNAAYALGLRITTAFATAQMVRGPFAAWKVVVWSKACQRILSGRTKAISP